MFELCKSNIADIEFFFAEKEELIDCTVGVKRCSEDENYSIVHNLLSGIKVQKDLNISDCVAYCYDGK